MNPPTFAGLPFVLESEGIQVYSNQPLKEVDLSNPTQAIVRFRDGSYIDLISGYKDLATEGSRIELLASSATPPS